MALTHCGVGKTVTDPNTDTGNEAKVLRIFYDTAIIETFEDYDWSFARKYAVLSLVEENPNSKWLYSYEYPTDCAAPREILSGMCNDTRQTRVLYEILNDATGRIICTNKQDAELKYTLKLQDAAAYTYAYKMAASFKLAALIIPKLSAGDPFGLAPKLESKYAYEISKAAANDGNQEQTQQDPPSEFQRFRNGGTYDDRGFN